MEGTWSRSPSFVAVIRPCRTARGIASYFLGLTLMFHAVYRRGRCSRHRQWVSSSQPLRQPHRHLHPTAALNLPLTPPGHDPAMSTETQQLPRADTWARSSRCRL